MGACAEALDTFELGSKRAGQHERAGVTARRVFLSFPDQHPFVKARSVYRQGCQFSGVLQVFDMEILAVGMDVPR